MPLLSQTQFSFAAGELAPALHGRGDLEKYQSGLKGARNVFVHGYGGLSNRPGTRYVGRIPDRPRLIDFRFSRTQTYILVFFHKKLRFITNGGFVLEDPRPVTSMSSTQVVALKHGFANDDEVYLHYPASMLHGRNCLVSRASTDAFVPLDLDGKALSHVSAAPWKGDASVARVYTLSVPYTGEELFDLTYAQSFDTMLLVHSAHEPQKLLRRKHADWGLESLKVAPRLGVPSSVKGVAVGGAVGGKENGIEYAYQVTALSEDGEEGLPSVTAKCTNDLAFHEAGKSPNYNTISWKSVSGAVRYRIYRQQAGTFGAIGATDATSLNDNNILPEMMITPPSSRNPFSGKGNNPSAVTFFGQRLVLARSDNKPQTIWASGIANICNFNVSTPAKADEAVTCTLASSELQDIRHLVGMENLLVLTSAAEWKISSPITPMTVNPVKMSENGCSNVPPLILNNQVLFISALGNEVRNMVPGSDGTNRLTYTSESLSLLAAHLFENGRHIVDWAYAKIPYGVVWAVRDDGILLSLTYLPEHQVVAWCRHDTDGKFESVAAVTEDNETAVYFVVRRRVMEQEVRFVEKLASRQLGNEGFFVDCGLSYRGEKTRLVGNLHHLEGKEVIALADGNVVRGLTVKEGQVKLPRPAGVIHIGLPYTAEIETLPLSFGAQTSGGVGPRKPKQIIHVTLKVKDTRGLWAGSDADRLYEYKQRSTEDWGEPVRQATGIMSHPIDGSWGPETTALVQQRDPLPMTILTLTPEMTLS